MARCPDLVVAIEPEDVTDVLRGFPLGHQACAAHVAKRLGAALAQGRQLFVVDLFPPGENETGARVNYLVPDPVDGQPVLTQATGVV